MKPALAALLLCTAAVAAAAQAPLPYQKPPAPIEQLLDAPAVPIVTVSPSRATMLIEQPAPFASIAEVAAPRLRLAGLRFNPVLAGPSAVTYTVGFRLQNIAPGVPSTIAGLPGKLAALYPMWSPDSKHIAFLQRADATPAEIKTGRNRTSSMAEPSGLQLWTIEVATLRARRLGFVHVNAILGRPCTWLPNSSGLLCKLVPASRTGAPPVVSNVPAGPNVSENLGKATPAPTYEDMLQNPSDEALFDYYATADLAEVPLSGALRILPTKGLIDSAAPSPDGRFALVQLLHRPFSYTVPAEAFPRKTEIITLSASSSAANNGYGYLKTLNDRPLIDNLPISRDAVEPGPRDYQWRADVPATVVWYEAANGGKPDPRAPVADTVKALDAPFEGNGTTLLEAPLRLAGGGPGGRGITWGSAHLALATTARFSDRKSALLLFDPSTPGKVTTLYAGSSQDRYHAPGRALTQLNAQGQPVLRLTPDGQAIYFLSPGASPTGDHPTLQTLALAGGAARPLFRSTDPFYSDPIALLSGDKLLVRRESPTESPNYFVATLTASAEAPSLVKITDFPSPYAAIAMPTHQLLHYKRADGVDLTATLWLPAGYGRAMGPLPTLMEAYPAEFKTRAAASQVSGSGNRFPTFGWGGSAVYFAQTGYAVLENAAIPIIGEGDQQPNDTYTAQLVAGAEAAIAAGVATGAVDRSRVAVMGHSYGAFMTANLLAHTTLFRAGIARSGAYNRTLTPYGFQNEERTYWQDAKVYYDMSPFSFADKIKTPILLIHGEADDNTGTYPIQSERFYAALKGQGATVRLVFLPLEAHHYSAHESLQHMLWEMNRWLDTYVKPITPVTTTTGN